MNTCPFSDLPPAIARLRRDGRGLPIPFTNHIYPDGTPDFRVIDPKKIRKCAKLRLCGICGEKLLGGVTFIGGTISAGNGLFTDAPMHEVCARYAKVTCPYLRGDKSYATTVHPRQKEEGMHFAVNPLVSTIRPEKMCFYFTVGFTLMKTSHGLIFKAMKPSKLEWWE
jgi:hypothetical protein